MNPNYHVMEDQVSIRIRNIRKNYGNVKVLRDVSMDVSKGELFGLIGPDGAGKTSIFRIITTLILPDEGEVSVNGKDVVKNYRYVRSITGYMPGKFSLYQDLTVDENISFFASVFNTDFDPDYAMIRDMYAQLATFSNRRAGKLSGGMKQKLALCCALIHQPEILILDEPTTGVDAVSRKEFWEILQMLKQTGITTMVSTPYMDEADQCDRVAMIQNGKILQTDTPKDITRNFTRKVMAIRTNNNYQSINHLKQFEHTRSVYPFGEYIHFIPTSNEIETGQISTYLKDKGESDIELHCIEPDIEDCFMELMRENN